MFPGVNEIMKRGAERGGDPPFIVFQGASPQWTPRLVGVAEPRHEDGRSKRESPPAPI